MTTFLSDPLAANPLPTYDPRRPQALPESSVHPFGLTHLGKTTPSGATPTGLVYDEIRQLNVIESGEVAAFKLPHAGTWSTVNTVQDHQEWPDRVED
ncbi:putative ATP-grasp-modified RiPP [Saccharomonospora glauca]|uniref:Uncharacterized protein n=1 Tax=Saccharomonospora glauca K62 TaxID=928724 RepID=I1CZY0_9PSEU|nr:putative ATP-grasp-modified RiPP [Saccharomonospora glauca]EIE98254.1 hypothetical protein SacglDRAFT_01328 [Saccharomonospora glauca K62]